MAIEKQSSSGLLADEGVLMSATPTQENLKREPGLAEVQEKPVGEAQRIQSSVPTSMSEVGQYVITSSRQGTELKPGERTLTPTGVWTSHTSVTRNVPLRSIAGTKTSVNTPNFRRLVQTGAILPVNNFANSLTTVNSVYRTASKKEYRDGTLMYIEEALGPFRNSAFPNANGIGLGPTSSQVDTLDRKARLAIRLKLKDQKVNIAMIVAERNKTASALAKIIKTIAEMVMALRRGNLAGAAAAVGAHVGYRKSRSWGREFGRNSSKAVANGWLELQYAIKPLLMDAKGLAEALAEHQYRKITGVASASASLNIDRDTRIGKFKRRVDKGTVKIRYTVYFQIDLPEMPDLAGLGLLNPPQLAWELVPFSFVVDWFIPIGDWLSSLDATIGMSFSDGSKSIKTDLSRTELHHELTDSSAMSVQYPALIRTVNEQRISTSYVVDSVVRTKLFSFPDVAFPSFSMPDSLNQFYSALALLRKQAR